MESGYLDIYPTMVGNPQPEMAYPSILQFEETTEVPSKLYNYNTCLELDAALRNLCQFFAFIAFSKAQQMDEEFVLVGKEDYCEPHMIRPNAVLEVISPSIPVLRKRNALTTGSVSEKTDGGEKKVRVFSAAASLVVLMISYA
jgi:hypothetical protein